MKINAIAIDDEPKALDIIKFLAEKVPFLNLKGVFSDPYKALEFLSENHVELIFLDINMPDISGLELSKVIKSKGSLVIFTTAYPEYALESYEVEALDYLLKPIEFNRFFTAVLKAKNRLYSIENPKKKFFFINTGNNQVKLCYDDIKYIEGSGNYVTYVTNNQKAVVRATIKNTLETLPSSLFIQVHKSYIVSLNHIDKIQDNHIYIGTTRTSIGLSFKENIKTIINRYS